MAFVRRSTEPVEPIIHRLRIHAPHDDGPAADGQEILIVTLSEDGAASPINIVLNWRAALKR